MALFGVVVFRWFRNLFTKTEVDARHRHPDNIRRRPFEAATTENITILQKQLVPVKHANAIETVHGSSLEPREKLLLIGEIVKDL